MTTKNTKISGSKKTITLNHHAAVSAKIYIDAVIEACTRLKLEPMRVLLDAADYPAIRKISELEFAIGWLHGCAEASGGTVEVVWNTYAPAKARAA